MSEVLAPAGDFGTALAAFEGGADAVYLGLEDFSARKRAKNFSILSLRRLLNHAHLQAKKVYVTINTLVEDEEFPLLNRILHQLDTIGVDAVIVQDIGVLAFIRKYYPNIEIHASTQMAIHNISGVLVARELGVSRVVLSREATLSTIAQIRKAVPEMELEVFVHGALCYSFSGMCLASGLMLGRSGNRGECAQICRNYFDRESETSQFTFSCNDLVLGSEALKLKALGVHSFKIEGRMKSAQYAFDVSNYYRGLLNGKESLQALDRALISFSRNPSTGYLFRPYGDGLLNPMYSGHTGVLAGTALFQQGRFLTFRASREIRSFDSLSLFRDGKFICGIKPQNLSIRRKRVDRCRSGDDATIEITNESIEGDEIRLLGISEKAMPGIDEKSYPPIKKLIPVSFEISEKSLSFIHGDTKISVDVELSKAQTPQEIEANIVSAFAQTGESLYGISLEEVRNTSNISNPFIPKSLIKQLKKNLLNHFDNIFVAPSYKTPDSPSLEVGTSTRMDLFLDDGMPFTQDHHDLNVDLLPVVGADVVVPLAPVLFEEGKYFDRLAELIEEQKSSHFLLGINNISHIHNISKWFDHPRVTFYSDFYLYMANDFAVELLSLKVPKLQFAYSWCEKGRVVRGTTHISDQKELPLFYSMGCYKAHNVDGCDKCSKDFTEELKNNEQVMQLIVKRCHTYLFIK
ncbi:MAG: U32 family peptidase [Bacteriovoracaceae bacterium]|nr:U32 family peptidase [Bacteriovoracaceae bacterium]